MINVTCRLSVYKLGWGLESKPMFIRDHLSVEDKKHSTFNRIIILLLPLLTFYFCWINSVTAHADACVSILQHPTIPYILLITVTTRPFHHHLVLEYRYLHLVHKSNKLHQLPVNWGLRDEGFWSKSFHSSSNSGIRATLCRSRIRSRPIIWQSLH